MNLEHFLLEHTAIAPYALFVMILLAGLNVPISIDVLLIVTAILAGTIYQKSALVLFLSFTIGCILSAWISYGLGRLLGSKIPKSRLLSKYLHADLIERMGNFYERFGIFTFIIGRFIPFGVRNCLFLSSGISKIPFWRFAVYDSVACTVWSGVFFSLLYNLSQNYQQLTNFMWWSNFAIFTAFSVTVIAFICYKVRKRKQPS